MLKSLRLQNFQCHSKLILDFDPQITTIVGTSDIGKSAVVRALSWLTFNSPSGDAFIRHGAQGCTVTLINDVAMIRRRRGKGVNQYEVDGKKFEAVGRGGIPAAVSESLSLGDLNFQYQHDAPLWLSQNAGQVAKNLNAIVDLDLIDRILGRLGRQTKLRSTELTVSQARLAQAEREKEGLKWVELATSDFDEVSKLERAATKAQIAYEQMFNVVQQAEISKHRITKYEDVLEPVLGVVEVLDTLQKQIDDKERQERALDSLLNSIKTQRATLRTLKEHLQMEKEKLASIKVCPLCNREFDHEHGV